MLATASLAWRLPADRTRSGAGSPVDAPGILLLGGIVVLVTLPVIDPGLAPGASAGVLALVSLLSVALILWERRYARSGRHPLFAPALLRAPGFLAGNAVALLWFGALVASNTVLTVYLLQSLGVPALGIALLMLPSAVARLVSTRFSARVFRRVGSRIVTAGTAAEGLGLLVIGVAATLFPDRAFALFAASAQLVLGVSSALLEPPLRAITLRQAPEGMAGVAASFLQLTQRLAATFTIALTTGILVSGASSPESLRDALLICGALGLAAAALSRLPSFREG